MIRAAALIAVLAAAAALAQSNLEPRSDMRAAHEMMRGPHMMRAPPPGAAVATQAGQDAFATIQEVVEILSADPKTDWSKVNIDALRRHLDDMNNVMLSASVRNEPSTAACASRSRGRGPFATPFAAWPQPTRR